MTDILTTLRDNLRTVIELGTVLGMLWAAWRGWLRLSIALAGIQELISAQLHENGGGSLVDKVNKLQHLHSSVDALADQLRRNNDEAKQQWQSLHQKDKDINDRLEKIEDMASGLRESLPERLRMQDDMGHRVESLETRMGRVERRLFDE